MIRSYLLLALVGTSLVAGNASEADKCASGDASCKGPVHGGGPDDQEVLLQSVMIHDKQALEEFVEGEAEGEEEEEGNTEEEEDAEGKEEEDAGGEVEEDAEGEEEEEEDAQIDQCKLYMTANSCPNPSCEWFDGVCQATCAAFKDELGCPGSRCTWSKMKCMEPAELKKTYKFKQSSMTKEKPLVVPRAANKVIEKQFGPGGDLILALPIVIANLTNYSSLISLSQDPKEKAKEKKVVAYSFGNPDNDKALLLDFASGYMTTLLADPDAKAAGVTEQCPPNDWTVITKCVELGLCLVQSHLAKNKSPGNLKRYALLEAVSAQYVDISSRFIDESLKFEEKALLQQSPGKIAFPTTISFAPMVWMACFWRARGHFASMGTATPPAAMIPSAPTM